MRLELKLLPVLLSPRYAWLRGQQISVPFGRMMHHSGYKQGTTSPAAQLYFPLYAMLLHVAFVPLPRNLSKTGGWSPCRAFGIIWLLLPNVQSHISRCHCQWFKKVLPEAQRVQSRRKGGIFLSLEAVSALNSTDKNFEQAVHLSSLRPSDNRINPPNTSWPENYKSRNTIVALGKTVCFSSELLSLNFLIFKNKIYWIKYLHNLFIRGFFCFVCFS